MELLSQNRQADFLRQMLLEIPGDAGDGPFLLLLRFRRSRYPLLIQRYFQVVDTCPELLIVHRLQNIVRDLQAQRLPAIGEVIVAGYDHKGGVRVLDTAELNHFQSVHNGNVDIHDNDIRAQHIDLCQCFHAVAGFARHLTVVGLPVKEPLEALPDHNFIIHQKHTQIFHCTSSFMGSSRWAVTPPVGFSV